jgi:hypothetical protein
MKLHIPEPCHENWNAMTPESQGRFCTSCSKTVVDFTGWPASRIQGYLTANNQGKTCGRFTKDQLAPDQAIVITIQAEELRTLPLHRYFLYALLIVFGTSLFSCTDFSGTRTTIGEVKVQDTLQAQTRDSLEQPPLMGKPVLEKDPQQENNIQGKHQHVPAPDINIDTDDLVLGEVAFPGDSLAPVKK